MKEKVEINAEPIPAKKGHVEMSAMATWGHYELEAGDPTIEYLNSDKINMLAM